MRSAVNPASLSNASGRLRPILRYRDCGWFACLLIVGALFLPVLFSSTAHAEVRFRLSLAWVTPVIEPRPGDRLVQASFMVTLADKGKVTETVSRTSGRRRQSSFQEREADLGDELGGRSGAQWRVLNESTLVRVAARPSHTFAIWLRTDGSRSCTVSLEWRLKPGFTAFEGRSRRDREPRIYTQPRVQEATCEVL